MVMRDPSDPLYKIDPFGNQMSKQFSLTNTGIGQFLEKDVINPLANIILGEDNEVGNIGQGIQNIFYSVTGQKEKTSTYKYEEALEKTKNQSLAADLEAAGLSKYGMTGSAPSGTGLSGSEPSGLQKLAAMIDMRKAMAEISNVEADSGLKAAQASDITANAEIRAKNYELDALRTASELERNDVLNELTRNQSQEVAENTLSIVSARTRAEAEHVYKLISMNVSNQLAYKDLNTYDERHESEMAVKRTSAYLNQQKAETEAKQREYIMKQIDEAAARIAHYAAQDQHLGYQDELLIKDYAYRQLQLEVLQYDYDYSQNHLIRTSDPVSRIAGVNFDQFVSGLGAFGDWTSGFSFKHTKTGSGGGSAW